MNAQVQNVPQTKEWADDSASLRRFGLALVRDERFVLDDSAAAQLVEKLIRQSGVASLAENKAPGRAALYARVVQLHRRHIRKLVQEEDPSWGEQPPRGPSVVSGIRALPLELREALLLVSLARLTHAEAAHALELPLAGFMERLDRARCRLATHMGVNVDAGANAWVASTHLRVIK